MKTACHHFVPQPKLLPFSTLLISSIHIFVTSFLFVVRSPFLNTLMHSPDGFDCFMDISPFKITIRYIRYLIPDIPYVKVKADMIENQYLHISLRSTGKAMNETRIISKLAINQSQSSICLRNAPCSSSSR